MPTVDVRTGALCLACAALNLTIEGSASAVTPEGSRAAAAVPEPAAAVRPASHGDALELDDVGLGGGVVAARTPSSALSLQGLILLHVADGVGAGGQLRVGNRGVRASFAYLPQHFIIDKDPWDDQLAHFEFANTAQLNIDAFQLFGQSEKGVSLSYRYSTLLGHGLGLAYQSHLQLGGQRFALSVPVIYYPKGSERVQREFGLQGGERINFPFGPRIDYGIGLAWLF